MRISRFIEMAIRQMKLYRYLIVLAIITLIAIAPGAYGVSTLQELSDDMSKLVSLASPAVVEIRADKGSKSLAGSFGTGAGRTKDISTAVYPVATIGSGFVFDEAGYILTTGNIVNGAVDITVRFADGSISDAELLGIDPATDLAVIKIDKKCLTALQFGDSDTLQPGSLVVQINNQVGLTNSASLGMISGVNRSVGGGGTDMIQISGTIGPGASGGPVLDPSGKVVGVSAAMFSPSPTALPFNAPTIVISPGDDPRMLQMEIERILENIFSGVNQDPDVKLPNVADPSQDDIERIINSMSSRIEIERISGSAGFAIPINRVIPVLEDLKRGKVVKRAWLGVSVAMSPFGILLQPAENGPAARAGIKPGDILIAVDNYPIYSAADVPSLILDKKPGEVIKLKVRREDKEIDVNVQLEERTAIGPMQEKISMIGIRKSNDPSAATEIDMRDADIYQIANALSEVFNKEVTVSDQFSPGQNITMQISAKTVEEALDAVFAALHCKYKKDGDVYTITP